MEIGIDSFAGSKMVADIDQPKQDARSMAELLERMECSDQVGLDVFGIGERDALVIGNPEVVAEKIMSHSESLGGISRFTFQMDNAGLSHTDLMRPIELIGTQVKPLIIAKA